MESAAFALACREMEETVSIFDYIFFSRLFLLWVFFFFAFEGGEQALLPVVRSTFLVGEESREKRGEGESVFERNGR